MSAAGSLDPNLVSGLIGFGGALIGALVGAGATLGGIVLNERFAQKHAAQAAQRARQEADRDRRRELYKQLLRELRVVLQVDGQLVDLATGAAGGPSKRREERATAAHDRIIELEAEVHLLLREEMTEALVAWRYAYARGDDDHDSPKLIRRRFDASMAAYTAVGATGRREFADLELPALVPDRS